MAISFSDYEAYGCPVCKTGERQGRTLISGFGTTVFSCSNCGVAYLICADELEQAKIGVGDEYPIVQDHPLKESNNG
jgi:hypothetical protein